MATVNVTSTGHVGFQFADRAGFLFAVATDFQAVSRRQFESAGCQLTEDFLA